MNYFMGFDDQFSKEKVENAKGELQLWQSTYNQIETKLNTVQTRLREIYGLPVKPQQKKNYALQKV